MTAWPSLSSLHNSRQWDWILLGVSTISCTYSWGYERKSSLLPTFPNPTLHTKDASLKFKSEECYRSWSTSVFSVCFSFLFFHHVSVTLCCVWNLLNQCITFWLSHRANHLLKTGYPLQASQVTANFRKTHPARHGDGVVSCLFSRRLSVSLT